MNIGKRKESNLNKNEKKSKTSVDENKRNADKMKTKILAMDAYQRHKFLVNEYMLTYSGATSQFKRDTRNDKTDYDVIKENHRFLWDEQEETSTWEKRLAKKYYDMLYKEYCITDLTFYKENKIALRWRIEAEVVNGKGQFTCANKHCTVNDELKTWEVNFAYDENGFKKNALVKLRLCEQCSIKLNYHHKRREVKRNKRKRNEKTKENESRENENYFTEKVQSINEDDHEVNKNNAILDEISTEATIAEPAKAKTVNTEAEEINVASTSSQSGNEKCSNIWLSTDEKIIEKTVDEEFDEYLADLFL